VSPPLPQRFPEIAFSPLGPTGIHSYRNMVLVNIAFLNITVIDHSGAERGTVIEVGDGDLNINDVF